MSTTTLVIVLLALAVVLYCTAPRQAVVHADVWARRTRVDVDREALVAELTHRLQVGAVGAGTGTLLGIVPLVAGVGTGDTSGPDGLADVAIVLTSTVVCAVASEAVNVVRRTPSPRGRRAASLVPRTAHGSTAERIGELALLAAAVAGFALAVATLVDGVDGGNGAVAAASGALVVMVVCIGVRARMVRQALVAEDDQTLAVATVAGAVSIDRFTENLLASGGVLTLTALLAPAIAAGPGALRTTALVLGALVVVLVGGLVAVRRTNRQAVAA